MKKRKNKIIRLTAYLLIALLVPLLTSTDTKIDSLKNEIETADEDTTKVKALNALGWAVMYSNPDTAISLSKQALALAETTGNEKSKANSLSNLGVYHYLKSDYPIALDYLFQSVEIRKKLNDKKGMASSYNNIGAIYYNQSDYPRALGYYFKSLKIEEEMANKQGMGRTYNNIGNIYAQQSDYPLALDYYFKSRKIKEELGNKHDMAMSYNNIGIIYEKQSNYPRALGYYFKSLKIFEELGNKQGMATSYVTIGMLYTALYENDTTIDWLGEWADDKTILLDTAMYYQETALAMQKELGALEQMTYSLSSMANIHSIKGNYPLAIEHYRQMLHLADTIGALHGAFVAHEGLSNTWKQWARKLTDYKRRADMLDSALVHHEQYSVLKDTVFNEEKKKDIGKLEGRFELEMEMLKREQHEKEQARIEWAQRQRRNILQYSAILLGIVALFIAILFSGRLNIPVRVAEGGIFFSFLLLFEFLLVLTDPYVDTWTGGEPAYKLLVNACFAGLIFPLHSFFEGALKRRLFKTKKKIIAGKLTKKKE